jgi:RNA polymerase sigma-70 factor (ECF subfamily)
VITFAGSRELPSRPSAADSPAAIAKVAAAYDAELVSRFNRGDNAAFDEIVGRYRDRMFRIALAFLRNDADAEEIAQDTFVRAFRGLARFRGESSLASWLHTITLNLARNHYWHFHRRKSHMTRSLDASLTDQSEATLADLIAVDGPDPAGQAAYREFDEQVVLCMKKLAVNHREILRLRNESGRTYEDIARSLGIGVGTVKSRIARARRNLRGFLAENYTADERDPSGSSSWFEPARPYGLVLASCG